MLSVEKCKNLDKWGFGREIHGVGWLYMAGTERPMSMLMDGKLSAHETKIPSLEEIKAFCMEQCQKKWEKAFCINTQSCMSGEHFADAENWNGECLENSGESDSEIDAVYNLCEKVCGGKDENC